ncbi:MAG: Flp pilus assembly complex ATPase component TadA [Clostridia bacterium]|nr:Flp pilus assembly complex ATPase component TadA [Clostridia bacterium]
MTFDDMTLQIADNLKRKLLFIPDNIKQNCEEIRLRTGLPVCLTVGGKTLFVYSDSSVCDIYSPDALIASKDDLKETLALLCKHSVYLHENEMRQGFISLPNGCRAGVCGEFNAEGMLTSVTSINIRIARQIFNCAKPLLPFSKRGLLIAGPPGSGKTTVLRDLVRLLSNDDGGEYYRVAVIDSRGEISGRGTLDLGVNTDVLRTEDKATGVEIALRTMYPQFIVFDEIGTLRELQSVSQCFNAGVNIITTAHAHSKCDLKRREIIQKMISHNVVSYVALLPENIGENPIVISAGDLKKYDDF